LECFITFSRCTKTSRGASDNIYKPLIVHTVSFLFENNSQISCKIPDCWYRPLSGHRKWLGCCAGCKERHILLLGCFIDFIRYSRVIKRASNSRVQTVSFLLKILSEFHPKYQILGTLSAREMRCCSRRRDTHCSLSVSQPFLDL